MTTEIGVTHIGGPTTLIEVGGWRLLTDPTFDSPGGDYGFGWGSHSRKVAGPALSPAQLGRIDVVLLSHDNHGDNLDAAGRSLLPRADRVLTTKPGAARLGGKVEGLLPWQVVRLEAPGRATMTVTATPCRHGPPLSRPIAGAVVGFAIEWEGLDRGAVWISGDTVLFEGVREVASRIDVGTALLHLGSVRFGVTGPVHYSLTAREAVKVCELMQPTTTIPVHYEGWTHFREGRAQIEGAFAHAPFEVRRQVLWVPIGKTVEVAA